MSVQDRTTMLHTSATVQGFLDKWHYRGAMDFRFPAGSMFWARISALKPILDLALTENDFEYKLGQIDGTCPTCC